MRNCVLFLVLFAPFQALIAMDDNRALIPAQLTQEVSNVKKENETKFDLLMAKMPNEESDFSVWINTLKGTNIPIVTIDEIDFVIFDGNINTKSLNLDFEGMNLVLMADFAVEGDVQITCDNIIFIGDIRSKGNVTVKTSHNFYNWGASLIAEGVLETNSGGRLVSRRMDANFRDALYRDMHKALRENDKRSFAISTISLLKSLSGLVGPKTPEQKQIQ